MPNANKHHERAHVPIDHDPMPLGLQLKQYFYQLRNDVSRTPRRLLIASIMGVALLAFEIFNYDTTRYALNNLLGDISFMNFGWASILAIAFCSIDFAGLVRIFTPERGRDEPKEVWYLMGAWLLGATMNAMMTWWAVSLTVLNHEIGSEIIPRETMLKIVPIFVAVLVWLTRILFIGALSVAGEQLMAERRNQQSRTAHRPDFAQASTPTTSVTVRQRQAVHLKERSGASQRPRPITQQETLIVNQPPRPVVANQPPPEAPEKQDPLTQLFEVKAAKKPVRPQRSKGVQRPRANNSTSPRRSATRPKTGGLRSTPNSNLQAKPRQ